MNPFISNNLFTDLKGKTALITGASSQGVGRQVAHLLSQFGAKVILSSAVSAAAHALGLAATPSAMQCPKQVLCN